MNRKKAQMTGQVFIYVLAIVIFGLTLLYGYRAIDYFRGTTDEISYLELENTLKNEVEKVQSDTLGTLKRKTITIPGNYDQLCFVNSPGRGPRQLSPDFDYPLIRDSLLAGTDANVFLYPSGKDSFHIGDIQKEHKPLEGDPQCVDIVGGKIRLQFESLGTHVKISRWG